MFHIHKCRKGILGIEIARQRTRWSHGRLQEGMERIIIFSLSQSTEMAIAIDKVEDAIARVEQGG